ncbi:MinD/ParA family ATP-binding protein [Cryobacterium aureum]|uniref:MinD/ParA family ATP-binding protein n=1 Tax=Cryobacterium aureum TaxID=995037 RepID=UPI000CF4405D|nr:cobalamin biosynthesis protein CobQ [Cryobacterium aureum]
MSPDVPALANTPADIVAAVQTDTTGEVTIDGSRRRVTGTDEAGVREEIIGLVVETARSRGRSVLLQVSDQQGDWPLTVHPNGRVESAGPVVVASRPKPANTAPLPVRPALDEPTPFATLLQPPVAAPASALFESLLLPTAVTPAPDATPPSPAAPPVAPNLADFLSSRPPAPAGPAEQGWQGAVRRLSGGLVSPTPSSTERQQRTAIAAVQRSLNGPRTIVVLNPKGGAHKTTATLLIAATFGIYRGGYTLAWDNNETMGTLGVRAQAARHTNTAVDLLRDLDRFGDARSRVGDLDNYVRSQGDAQFDALASDLDPAGAASIDDDAFRKLHTTLSRFYRVLVIDTGNNMRASNWEAAVDTADQLVIVSTIREDTGYGAASLIDGLRQKGHADKVAQAVTVLASPSKTADEQLSKRLHDHFRQLTRTVVDVPYDASLVGGGPLNVDALAPRTRTAWLQATAAIAEGL